MLRAVRVDLQSNTPVLLLQETGGEGRTLPIFIGNPEATAIAYALQGVSMPRPLTHDLMRDMLGALEISVERVVISELRASTYFAELHLVRGDETTVVSSRPSDAVAGHPVECHTVNRSEQLPVQKTRDTTRTEGSYLADGTLSNVIPQPGVAGEPPDTAQHELVRFDLHDLPPIDDRPRHNGVRP